jgi:hypothetical protein
MVLLVISTLIIAAMAGFMSLTGGELLCGVAGQVAHGLLSIMCFALVGVAFWRFGWRFGGVDLVLVLIVANASLSFCRYLSKGTGL